MQNNESSAERVYAGFFVRLAAYVIDWLIVGAALLVIKIPIWISVFWGGSFLMDDFIFRYSAYDILIYLLKVVYFVLLTYYTGATLGKKLMNIAVVSEEDRKPTFFEIVYRESVGKFLSGLVFSVGYIIIGLDKKKKGLHDHLADTCVIYRHKKMVYVAAPVTVQKKPYISTQAASQNQYRSSGQDSYVPAGQNTDMFSGQSQQMEVQSEYQNFEIHAEPEDISAGQSGSLDPTETSAGQKDLTETSGVEESGISDGKISNYGE